MSDSLTGLHCLEFLSLVQDIVNAYVTYFHCVIILTVLVGCIICHSSRVYHKLCCEHSDISLERGQILDVKMSLYTLYSILLCVPHTRPPKHKQPLEEGGTKIPKCQQQLAVE